MRLRIGSALGLLGFLVGSLSLGAEADRLRSPAMESLRRTLKARPAAAAAVIDDFLRDRRTPIVEPAPAPVPAGWSLVTFLWLGEEGTRAVQLQGGRPSGEAAAPLTRLVGTDLWYRSDLLPNASRFSYSFVVNGPAEVPDRIDEFGDSPEAEVDPRNANLNHGASFVVLPEALPFPYPVNPKAREGRIVERKFQSAAVGDTIELSIYLPAAGDASSPPWLAIVFDGGFEEMKTVLDDLIARKKIPPVVVVGVENRMGMRVQDLGYSEPFAKFVAEELLPWAQEEFTTTRRSSETILGGASRGAGMTAFVGLRYPERFPNLLCISMAIENLPGSFPPARFWLRDQDAWIVERYIEAPKKDLHFFLAVGRFDTSLWTDRLINNRRLRDVLRAKGYPVTFADPWGGHDHLLFQQAYVDGLIALTRDG